MGKRNGSQTTNTGISPQDRWYVNQMRNAGTQGRNAALNPEGSFFSGPITPEQIQAAMNPYLSNVVDATRGEFDFMRQQAMRNGDAMATQAGAFGGSRHGAMVGTQLGALDRAQGSQIANLMQQGHGQALQFADHQRALNDQRLQEPLFRQQQALNFLNMGMGPMGTQVRQSGQGGSNPFGSAMGGAMMGSAFGPWGVGLGALGGFLGGLF